MASRDFRGLTERFSWLQWLAGLFHRVVSEGLTVSGGPQGYFRGIRGILGHIKKVLGDLRGASKGLRHLQRVFFGSQGRVR